MLLGVIMCYWVLLYVIRC